MLSLLTYSHAIAGTLALVVAPIAIATRKGGRHHIRWGRVFFWCMTYVFITAVILSVIKWIPFLLMIAFFSYYSIVIAYRSVHQKNIHRGLGVRWFDWCMLIVAGVFDLGFAGYGIYQLSGGATALGILALTFGVGGCIQVVSKCVVFIRPPQDKMYWLYSHGGNMLGGFIAAVTAFSTQTIHFLPDFLVWTWPSLLGIPLIALTMRYYRGKLSKGGSVGALVQWRS